MTDVEVVWEANESIGGAQASFGDLARLAALIIAVIDGLALAGAIPDERDGSEQPRHERREELTQDQCASRF